MHRFAQQGSVRSIRTMKTEATSIADLVSRFPPASIARLRRINEASTSSRHVLLALGFGAVDPHIGKLNHVIVKLLVRRLRAERAGDHEVISRIESKLKELHGAIDAVTGICMADTGSVCASVMKPSMANQ